MNSANLSLGQELLIPGRLPGLNDMVGENHHVYGRLKRKFAQQLASLARIQRFKPVSGGHFAYLFTEPNNRRDPANFCFGAIKFIEDALQEAGLLQGDGHSNIWSYSLSWTTGKKASVSLFVAGTPWEESREDREQKGQSKFRRRAGSTAGLQKVAGKATVRRKPKASARLPERNQPRAGSGRTGHG